MRKKILLFVCFLFNIIGYSQCNYSFVMTDSGNNGWNGNTMSIKQNGVTLATIGSTFTSGGGPVTVQVPLQDNVPFQLFWNTGGSSPAQIGVSIVNPFSQTIYTKPFGTTQNVVLYSATANCNQPVCVDPGSPAISAITMNSSKMTWTTGGGATQWETVVLPSGNFPSGQSGVITSNNYFNFSGLACGTAYSAFVRSVCPTSTGQWMGPVNFTTQNCWTSTSSMCLGANFICDFGGYVYANITGVSNQGTMGCLSSTPNLGWAYFSPSTSGSVNLKITQNSSFDVNGNPIGTSIDADYIIYGPYDEPIVSSCGDFLTPDKIVSCSYSAAAIEYPSFTAPQAGKYYYIGITNFSNNPGFIKLEKLPTTTALLGCTGFQLNAFLDNNSNGIKDNGEVAFPHGQFVYEKNSDGVIHDIASSTGGFNIAETNPANSYDFSFQINSEYAPYFNLSTASYNNSTVTPELITEVNFPVTVSGALEDVSLNIISLGEPRPGFSYANRIIYKNNGNQSIANGTVSFVKDNALTINNVSQSGILTTSDGFTYNFTNLMPFETRIIDVSMQVPSIPSVNLGDLVVNTGSIADGSGSDNLTANNNFTLTEEITGAYDPNDIIETHGNEILYSSFSNSDYLYFTIRFENTGNGAAKNVKINNALDYRLDETSLQMIASSSSYFMDRTETNVDWKFNNIYLQPTSLDPNASKGYIVYKIKPKPGYAAGDIIPSTASIYFDFNPGVITNTFNTEFVSQLSVSEFENSTFVFYPNPVKDLLTVSVKNTNDVLSYIVISDFSGKVILQKKAETISSEVLDLSNFSKGMYLIEVTTKANLKTIKKLIVE